MGRALRVQNGVELGRVGSQGQNSGRVCWVHLAALDFLIYSNQGGGIMPTTKACPHQVLKTTGAPEVCLRSARMKFCWSEKNNQKTYCIMYVLHLGISKSECFKGI